MIFLATIVSVFSLNSCAQIRTDRMPAGPELHAPFNMQAPANAVSFPENNLRIYADQRLCGLPHPVAVNAATQHLPFFCGQELKAEKRLGVPLRLRLGSVQYTDWLEQKPGAVAPR
jgi:hypothetical protein